MQRWIIAVMVRIYHEVPSHKLYQEYSLALSVLRATANTYQLLNFTLSFEQLILLLVIHPPKIFLHALKICTD